MADGPFPLVMIPIAPPFIPGRIVSEVSYVEKRHLKRHGGPVVSPDAPRERRLIRQRAAKLKRGSLVDRAR
jgi:hypothetical protein